MLLVSIPKPCHENWDEMTPVDRGAFCGVCSKTVVDFTKLSDEEVKNYLLSRRDQKTCGKFRNDQAIDAGNPLPQLLASALPFWKKFLAIVFVLFGTMLTACNNRETTMGIMTPEPEKNVIPDSNWTKLEGTHSVGYIMPGQELEITVDTGGVPPKECIVPVKGETEVFGDTVIYPLPEHQGPDTIAIPIDNPVSLDENGNGKRND